MTDTSETIAQLKRQMQLLLDEREITRVLLALARTVDQKDFEGLAALYAENGELVLPRGGHKGRAGLAKFVGGDLGHYTALHHVGAGIEVQVEPGADTATARTTLLATHVTDDEGKAITTLGGFYDVKLIREDGSWRLLRVEPQAQWRLVAEGDAVAKAPASF